MKLKSWLFVLIALAVFIVALTGYMAHHNRGGSKSLHDQIRLHAPGQVTYFELSAMGEEKMRFTKHDNNWVINDSIAVDPLAVTDMLASLQRILVRSPVALENRQKIMQQLDDTGVHVKLFAKKHWIRLPGNIRLFERMKLLYEVVVGDDVNDSDGTYLSTGRGKYPYVVYLPGQEGGISRFFSINKHAWTDPLIIRVHPANISEVKVQDFNNPGESFHLFIDEDDFSFINHNGKETDKVLINKDKLGRFIRAFGQLMHERKLPLNHNCKPDDIMPGGPFFRVTVKSTSDDSFELQFFRRKRPDDGTLVSKYRNYDPNRFYIKTGECDYAIAQYYIFQPIIRPLSYFLND